MTYPHGGAGQIWRDGAIHNPSKSEIRDWGRYIEDGSAVGRCDIRAFGAALDGVTDDRDALLAAKNAVTGTKVTVYAPNDGSLYLAGDVDLRGHSYFQIDCDIEVADGATITIGGTAQERRGQFVFQNVTDSTPPLTTAPADPVFRIFGMKNAKIQIGDCNHIQLYADDSDVNTNSTAYNQIVITGVNRLFSIADAGGSLSWVTRNTISGGRMVELSIVGTSYPHNNNRFVDNTFEGADVQFTFDYCANNQIETARLEGAVNPVTCRNGAYGNSVECTATSVGKIRALFSPKLAFSEDDTSLTNYVKMRAAVDYEFTLLCATGAAPIIGNASDNTLPYPAFPFQAPTVTPRFTGFEATTFDTVLLTDLVPVEKGNVFWLDLDAEDSAGAFARCYIFVYDANGVPLTSEGGSGVYVDFPGLSSLSSLSGTGKGYYGHSANALTETIRRYRGGVERPEVGFIQIAVVSYGAGIWNRAAAYLYTPPCVGSKARAIVPPQTELVLTGAPTRGYAGTGTTVVDASGPTRRMVTFAWETHANGAVVAAAASITVHAISTVANGDICGVQLDDGSTLWTMVSALSGSTFTIDAVPAGLSVVDGARVVFNRWAVV